MEFEGREYYLGDDGTMDTVIDIWCPKCGANWEERVDCESAADYRDESGAMVDFDLMIRDFFSCGDCPDCDG